MAYGGTVTKDGGRERKESPRTVDDVTEEVPEEEHEAEGGGSRRQEVRLHHKAAEHVEGCDVQGKAALRGPHHYPHHGAHG